jgi:hypothetical protein
MTCPLFDEGKPIISKICENYKLNKFEIAKEMRENEIFDDVKTLIHEIHEMCKTNE